MNQEKKKFYMKVTLFIFIIIAVVVGGVFTYRGLTAEDRNNQQNNEEPNQITGRFSHRHRPEVTASDLEYCDVVLELNEDGSFNFDFFTEDCWVFFNLSGTYRVTDEEITFRTTHVGENTLEDDLTENHHPNYDTELLENNLGQYISYPEVEIVNHNTIRLIVNHEITYTLRRQ